MTDEYGNFIDGEWVETESGETFENRNPADRTDLIGLFQQSTAADAERAVAAASDAADDWAATPGPARGEILREAAKNIEARYDELADTLSREEGKTLAEAGEVARAYDIFYYYAEKARDLGGVNKQSTTADRAVELPGCHPCLEARTGPRDRQYGRVQASLGRAERRAKAGRVSRRRGASRRRGELRHWTRERGR